MGFDLHDSISEQYLFFTSAIEIRVCQKPGPGAMHESMLSDVPIGENVPPPLHNNGVTTLYDFEINVIIRDFNGHPGSCGALKR